MLVWICHGQCGAKYRCHLSLRNIKCIFIDEYRSSTQGSHVLFGSSNSILLASTLANHRKMGVFEISEKGAALAWVV